MVIPLIGADGPRSFVSDNDPVFSIIIPVKNGWSLTSRALVAIADRTCGTTTPYEVVIADDNSTDETTQCESKFPGLKRVVNSSGEHGFVANVNFAAAHGSGKYLVLLNNDTEVQDGWLAGILRAFESGPRVGIVGPRLVYPDGRLQEAGCTVFPSGLTQNEGRGKAPDDPQFATRRPCDYVSGACLAIQRALWSQLNGFDDRFMPAYYEDVDLCIRAWNEDYAVLYEPSSVVMHVDGGSMKGVRDDLLTQQRAKFNQKWSQLLKLNERSKPQFVSYLTQFDLIRRAWRAIPISDKLRVGIFSYVMGPPKRALNEIKETTEGQPGRCAVAGYLQSGLGLGEAGRLDVQMLNRCGYAPSRIDLSPAFGLVDLLDSGFANTILSEGGPIIVRSNPLDLPRSLWYIGQHTLRHRYVIGSWAWELPKAPASTRDLYPFLKELWVCSNFCASVFKDECPVPIHVVPIPATPPPTAGKSRQDFGLSDDDVVFLAMADMRSSFDRKNLAGAVTGFVQACGDMPNVKLVIKTHHVAKGPQNLERLMRIIGNVKNVEVWDRFLTRAEVGDLLRSVDVFLSPHRAEGFGLVLAESMLLGKPVVATNYSGNVDFMPAGSAALIDYELVDVVDATNIYGGEGQVWADPNLDQLATEIHRLAVSESWRMELGQAGQNHATGYFTPERFKAALSPKFRELSVAY